MTRIWRLAVIIALILGISSASENHGEEDHDGEDDHDDHSEGNHSEEDHGEDDHDHGHGEEDHDGEHDHDDHSEGNHSEEDHSEDDHSEDDHSEDGHSEHDHDHGEDDHDHGHDEDDFMGNCVCQAQAKDWKLDCNDMTAIQTAITDLEADPACKSGEKTSHCENDYYIMQAHHDHCLHDQLPTDIEHTLHEYEEYYTDCFVKRQYDPELGKCPVVDCANSALLNSAVETLLGGCSTTTTCAESTCASAIKTVLMAHDTCPKSSLLSSLEKALHDHEEPCEAQLCNSGDFPFDPYSTACSAEVSVASRLWSREAFLVIASVALFNLIPSPACTRCQYL